MSMHRCSARWLPVFGVVTATCFAGPLLLHAQAATGPPTTSEQPEGALGEWTLSTLSGAKAVLESDSLDPSVLRVRPQESPRGQAGDISLQRAVSLPGGGQCQLIFQGRGQFRRPIFVRLGNQDAASEGTEVVLGAQRSEFKLSFPTPADATNLRLSFDLGAELGGIEIANVRIQSGGTSIPLSNAAPTVTLVSGEVGEGPSAADPKPADPPPTPAVPPIAKAPPRYSLFTHEGAQATVRELPAEGALPSRLRIEVANPGKETWHVQFAVPSPAVEVGKECEVKIRVRTDKDRKIVVAASRTGPDDWSNVGLFETRPINTEWQELALTFKPTVAEAKPRVQIDVGGDPTAVEVAAIAFRTPDKSADLLSFPAAAAPKAAANPKEGGPDGPPVADDSPWKLAQAEGGEARLESLGGTPPVTAVRIASPGSKIYSVQINHAGLTFRKGAKCELSMELRASQPRPAAIAVSHSGAKNSSLGLYSKRELSTEWKKYTFPFIANEDSDSARIHLDLGQAPGDVEIRNVQLTADGSRVAIGPEPRPAGPIRTAEETKSPASSPPQQSQVPSSSSIGDWELSSEQLKARLTVLSLSPWHAEMVVDPPIAPEGRVVLRRGLGASQTPVVLRVQGKPLGPNSGPARIEVRLMSGSSVLTTQSVDLGENWRNVKLEAGPGAANPDRVEVVARSPMIVGVSESLP